MAAWYSSNTLLDVLVYCSSCTCDDWYDLCLLVPYFLALNLEIYILAHLLCGLLLDVVVTWNGHIYDLAPIRLLLLYDYVWFVAGDMSVSDDWGVPQDSYLPILHWHYLLSILLYEFYIKAGSMCLKLCYCNCYLFGVVSTSPVVWSQVRWFFLMRIVFCTINHDEKHESLWLSIDLFLLDSLVCNTVGLHNSLLFTIVQFAQWFTLYNSTQRLWVQYIVYGLQVLTNSSMEPPSRTTPSLDILFTPPVYKTYIFLQDFSSRDNLMLPVKAVALRLSIKYD